MPFRIRKTSSAFATLSLQSAGPFRSASSCANLDPEHEYDVLVVGSGVGPHLVQTPSEHLIGMNVYANFLEIAVADLQTTATMFLRYATEEHQNQRPMV